MTTLVQSMSAKIKVTIEHELELSDENAKHLLTTAIEGSSYWATWEPADEWVYQVRDIEDDDSEWMEVTLFTMLQGIQKYVTAWPSVKLTHEMLNLCGLSQDGDYDANDADLILQYALFNEERYC